MTPCQKLLKQEGTARRIESMQQSSATQSLHLWFLGVAEDCCMLSILLAVPSCFNSFWHGVIPTSYFIFNDFYTCNMCTHVHYSTRSLHSTRIWLEWYIWSATVIHNRLLNCIGLSATWDVLLSSHIRHNCTHISHVSMSLFLCGFKLACIDVCVWHSVWSTWFCCCWDYNQLHKDMSCVAYIFIVRCHVYALYMYMLCSLLTD